VDLRFTQPLTEMSATNLREVELSRCVKLHGLFHRDSFTFLYVDDVRTSRETHLWPSMAYYRDRIFYVDDVRTSKEIHPPMDLHGVLRA
jgi:hypothetical protein